MNKRLATLFRGLGIKDWGEDFYALRKTLSTSLSKAGVEESVRQVIAGHAGGSVLNIHYTSHDPDHLKAALDAVDFRLNITWSDQRGFPVITGCNLAEEMVDVDVVLASDGGAASVSIGGRDGAAPELVVAMAGTAKPRKGARHAIVARDMTEAARMVREALRGHKPRTLRNPARQTALDHLLMLAHPVQSGPGPAPAIVPEQALP